MPADASSLVVGAALAGKRLDAALAMLAAHTSLRARRRLIANGIALVDGKTGRPGQKLLLGQRITLAPVPDASAVFPSGQGPALLSSRNGYHFFYKPPCLHTQKLAASATPALEDYCARLAEHKVELLQRLDFNTSGIVCGADNSEAAARFRHAEKTGSCRKYYLALLCGPLRAEVVAKNALNCENRRKTAVLQTIGEANRWTIFRPLQKFWPKEGMSGLEAEKDRRAAALCIIQRGQRHQIRAHAAAIGHPLAGDELYGGGAGQYLLIHFCMHFPGQTFFYLPPGLPKPFAENSFLTILKEAVGEDLQSRPPP